MIFGSTASAKVLKPEMQMHNVLRSSNVIDVGQFFFVINQSLQMIVMVLVMVVD